MNIVLFGVVIIFVLIFLCVGIAVAVLRGIIKAPYLSAVKATLFALIGFVTYLKCLNEQLTFVHAIIVIIPLMECCSNIWDVLMFKKSQQQKK